MKDFDTLITNYEQVLQAVPDAAATLIHAYACALNLTALLSDTSEQNTLADLLWKIQGKVIARADILKAIVGINQTQFGLASEAFISSQSLAVGSALFQQAPPTILLQTVDAATASPSPTQAAQDMHPTPTVPLTPLPTATPSIVKQSSTPLIPSPYASQVIPRAPTSTSP